LVTLCFELRALQLLGKCSTIWATHQSFCFWFVFQIGPCTFTWARLRHASPISASWVPGIIGMNRHTQLLLCLLTHPHLGIQAYSVCHNKWARKFKLGVPCNCGFLEFFYLLKVTRSKSPGPCCFWMVIGQDGNGYPYSLQILGAMIFSLIWLFFSLAPLGCWVFSLFGRPRWLLWRAKNNSLWSPFCYPHMAYLHKRRWPFPGHDRGFLPSLAIGGSPECANSFRHHTS
jgi:hypothetical protein